MHPIDAGSTPPTPARRPDAGRTWERPRWEVVCLACEISAYTPDEGEPLF